MDDGGEIAKSRLTLWVADSVKDELRKQAREAGVSMSAYISMIIHARATRHDLAGV